MLYRNHLAGPWIVALCKDFLLYMLFALIVLEVILVVSDCICYYQRWKSKKRRLLILDLNNLLVCRAFKPKMIEEYSLYLPHIKDAKLLDDHYTWKRPNLSFFLWHIFIHYDVAVWSSAQQKNVDKLCEYIFSADQRARLLFEWDQSHCTSVVPHPDPSEKKPLFEKQLRRVWKEFPQYDKDSTLIIDDSSLKMRSNPTECVYIAEAWNATMTEDNQLEWNGDIFKRLRL